MTNPLLEHIEKLRKELPPNEVGKISDGYHTFDELYRHRIELFITVCTLLRTLHISEYEASNSTFPIWKSRTHSNGTSWEGWFLLGINYAPGTQITYHLPDSYWNSCPFEELQKAPQFDGHTSDDVIERLKKL